MDDSSRVVFVHPNLAADLIGRVQAGEPIECKLIDGELSELCGVKVIVSGTAPRFRASFEGFRVHVSESIKAAASQPRRGAQWKAERGLSRLRGR